MIETTYNGFVQFHFRGDQPVVRLSGDFSPEDLEKFLEQIRERYPYYKPEGK